MQPCLNNNIYFQDKMENSFCLQGAQCFRDKYRQGHVQCHLCECDVKNVHMLHKA